MASKTRFPEGRSPGFGSHGYRRGRANENDVKDYYKMTYSFTDLLLAGVTIEHAVPNSDYVVSQGARDEPPHIVALSATHNELQKRTRPSPPDKHGHTASSGGPFTLRVLNDLRVPRARGEDRHLPGTAQPDGQAGE